MFSLSFCPFGFGYLLLLIVRALEASLRTFLRCFCSSSSCSAVEARRLGARGAFYEWNMEVKYIENNNAGSITLIGNLHPNNQLRVVISISWEVE